MTTLIDDQDDARAGEQGKDVPLIESEDDLGIDTSDDSTGDQHAGDKPDGADESEEGDEGDEGADDDAGAGDPPPKSGKKPPESVPYVRFKEVNDAKKAANEAREAAEREAAELRARVEAHERKAAIDAAKPADEDALKQAIRDAKARVRDAELDDDAQALQQAQDAEEDARQALSDARMNARRAIEQQQAAEDAQRRTAQTEQEKLNTAAAELMQEYPALQGDEQATRYILADRDALIASGKSWGDALREATHAVASRLGLKPTAAGVKSQREQESIRKHATAAATLPSRTGPAGEGNRARTQSRDLSPREYDELPQDEKDKYLGIA